MRGDIFGRQPDDYEVLRELRKEGGQKRMDDYMRSNEAFVPGAHGQRHNFDALGGLQQRQGVGDMAQAVGFLTNNLLAIQTMVDEILYTSYRLPRFVHLNTNIPEGASTYGIRTLDRRGRAQRVDAPGFSAPSAAVSQGLVTQRLDWYGLDAEWSIEELRGAMFGGIALDTLSIEAAVTGTLETMEAVGLLGTGDGSDGGLLNLPSSNEGADPSMVYRVATRSTFTGMEPTEIRTLINNQISAVIESTRETLGSHINSGMTVYLPGPQYDLLTTLYIGDNAENTLMYSLKKDNPWTTFAGTPLMIERVLELSGVTDGGDDRMVVAVKHSRVAEMGVSIPPRVLRIMDKGRLACAQIEAKFSPLFVKRPNTIRYIDAI